MIPRLLPRLLPFLALGCSPGAVVTVQPNAIPKTAFEGEWYWRRTVEEVPYGTSIAFVGGQDQLERVRFDIEENLLVVRRATPNVDASGADPGAPLLVFPIIIYFWKVIVFDKVLGLGTTDPITGMISDWTGMIITAYVGGRSIEKVARIFARLS